MSTAEDIRWDMFKKKLHPESHLGWQWVHCFAGNAGGKPVERLIEESLAAGLQVKAGYTCTRIRGYHDRWILLRDKKNLK